MFEIVANSGDPFHLSSFLHPGSYPSQSYLDVIERFAAIYFIPLFLVAVLLAITLLLFRRRARFSPLELPMILLPGILWMILVYADPSYKAQSNMLELAVLGGLTGLCVGLNGRLIRPTMNTISIIWVLCAVAILFYIYVPANPQFTMSW
jgi:hypothetical protein